MSDPALRVVVVDDDEDFRLMLRLQLDLEPGVEVVGTASDGYEALEKVVETAPDAVAMDLLMPNLDGFSAIERLREGHPAVGVVAYTAVAGQYARDRVAEQRVELVLKSGDPTELVDALRRSVSRAPDSSGESGPSG